MNSRQKVLYRDKRVEMRFFLQICRKKKIINNHSETGKIAKLKVYRVQNLLYQAKRLKSDSFYVCKKIITKLDPPPPPKKK